MLRTAIFLLVLLATALAGSPALALNAMYDPHWKVGDHWTVRVTVPVRQGSFPPTASATQDVDYTYSVTHQTTINGKPAWMLSVTPLTPGYSSWILDYDASSLALLRVQQGLVLGSLVVTPNPFGDDAWMPALGAFDDQIVHDTVVLPNVNKNQTRTLSAPQSSTPDFQQAVMFLAKSVNVTLSRTDPITSRMQKTVIVWTPGQKWWTSATLTLGTETLVTARLL